jgi:hypothetical protein
MGPLHSVVSSNVVFGDARGEGKMAMNQSEEVAETRKRVENQYGKELASKASDAFCLAFGRQVAPQGTVDQPELNNKRVRAKPLLMIEVSKEGPHEPAPAILSQRALPRLPPLRRGPHSDP